MNEMTKERYFLSRLEKALPNVTNHKGFRFKLGAVGYRDLTFGTRFIFPQKDNLGALFHEIAHAIEFGGQSFEERSSKSRGFHFHTPLVYFAGYSYNDCKTHQATDRELRTWAIEIALLKKAGVKKSIYKMALERAETIKYMNDYANAAYCKTVKRAAFKSGINKKELHGLKYDNIVIQFYAKKIVKLIAKVDTEHCHKEFMIWLDNSYNELQKSL